MQFIQNLAAALDGNVLNLLVYAIILFVFILGLFECIFPVGRSRRRLRRAVKTIRAGGEGRQAWQEDGFLGRGVLFSHWSEYLNNLFFADGVYHNASNVEDYINEDTVIYGPGRSSFADAVPGLLVSIGFLGTLIGLAQGLAGFSMSDSDAVMTSIVTLIPGMRYAFMTSIFGVVGSVAFTLITRAVYGSTEHTIRSFYSAMSRYAGVLSVDPMTQVAIYQQEQTAIIRKMADALDTGFSDRIGEAVEKAVEPLNQSMRAFVSVSSKEQMRFLDAVVTRFMDRMDDALRGQLKNLSGALQETADAQKSALGAVNESLTDTTNMLDGIREVARICNEMVNTNAGYIEGLRDNQKEAQDTYTRIASSVEQMDLVARQQTAYLKTVSAMQAEVTHSVDAMTGTVGNFTKHFAEESAQASTSMMKAAADLRATGAELKDMHADCTKAISSELKMTLDAYQDYVNQFTQRVNHLSAGITDALSKLPAAVDDSSGAFLDQIDRMTAVLERAQTDLNDAVRRLDLDRPVR